MDPNYPIEDQIRALAGLIKEGLFDHIGMSECSAETLRRANAIHPITMVEIEVSPWSIEEETKKGSHDRATCRGRMLIDLLYKFWQPHKNSILL